MPTRSKDDILAEIEDVELLLEATYDDLETAELNISYAESELMQLEDLLDELQEELSQMETEDEAE